MCLSYFSFYLRIFYKQIERSCINVLFWRISVNISIGQFKQVGVVLRKHILFVFVNIFFLFLRIGKNALYKKNKLKNNCESLANIDKRVMKVRFVFSMFLETKWDATEPECRWYIRSDAVEVLLGISAFLRFSLHLNVQMRTLYSYSY